MISDLLDYRSNVQFFREDKIPPKEEIESILKTVHERLPHSNMRWHYNIDVLGPEETELKRKLAISSVCADDPDFWRGEDVSASDWKRVESAYDSWREYQRNSELWKDEDLIEGSGWSLPLPESGLNDDDLLGFNEQVTAPYVLVYKPTITTFHPSIAEKAKKEVESRGWNRDVQAGIVEPKHYLVQIGMHSAITAMLALEKGYDVSYTRCLIFDNKGFLFDDSKLWLSDQKPEFCLSIGYPIEPRRSHSTGTMLPPGTPGMGIPRPDIEDIVKW